MSEVRDKNLEHLLKEQERLEKEKKKVKRVWKKLSPSQKMRRIESMIGTYREIIRLVDQNIENLKKTREILVGEIARLKWRWHHYYVETKKSVEK